MVRRIITIEEALCNGCGLCAAACHEGAIGMVNGKAKLLRDEYCDGLGDCLPTCPTGAIQFQQREAAPFDKAAVEARLAAAKAGHAAGTCPSSKPGGFALPAEGAAASALTSWPVQIRLVPAVAPCFNGADLLVAADCTAFAYAGFHQRFMRGRVTLVGCPKLDGQDYSEKLGAILNGNTVRSVTVVRMQVPCCAGLALAAQSSVEACPRDIPFQVVTLGTDGHVQ